MSRVVLDVDRRLQNGIVVRSARRRRARAEARTAEARTRLHEERREWVATLPHVSERLRITPTASDPYWPNPKPEDFYDVTCSEVSRPVSVSRCLKCPHLLAVLEEAGSPRFLACGQALGQTRGGPFAFPGDAPQILEEEETAELSWRDEEEARASPDDETRALTLAAIEAELAELRDPSSPDDPSEAT